MPAQWTGDILGKMHINGITCKQLAAAAGLQDKYLSAILNGHREPKGAEQKLNAALDDLLAKKVSADDAM